MWMPRGVHGGTVSLPFISQRPSSITSTFSWPWMERLLPSLGKPSDFDHGSFRSRQQFLPHVGSKHVFLTCSSTHPTSPTFCSSRCARAMMQSKAISFFHPILPYRTSTRTRPRLQRGFLRVRLERRSPIEPEGCVQSNPNDHQHRVRRGASSTHVRIAERVCERRTPLGDEQAVRRRFGGKWKVHRSTMRRAAAMRLGTRKRMAQTCRAQGEGSTQRRTIRKTLARKLSGDDFRHPLDQQNTALLRALPGFSTLARAAVGSVAEQAMLLENVGSCVRVGETQLPKMHRMHTEAAAILGLDPAPELYVRQDPQPNAYTLAVSGRTPFVVIHTALLELLNMNELQAVLAHEMGHLKCDHGVWLSMALAMADGATRMPGLGGLLATPMQDGLLRWLRAAELTCDRAALLVVQDPKIVVSALMKLAGGSPSIAKELNVDAFLEQARSYDQATRSPMGWYLRNAQTRQLSHPLPVLRAREIDRWASSPEYRALLGIAE